MPKRYILRWERNLVLESDSGKEEHWLVVSELGDVLEKVLIDFGNGQLFKIFRTLIRKVVNVFFCRATTGLLILFPNNTFLSSLEAGSTRLMTTHTTRLSMFRSLKSTVIFNYIKLETSETSWVDFWLDWGVLHDNMDISALNSFKQLCCNNRVLWLSNLDAVVNGVCIFGC